MPKEERREQLVELVRQETSDPASLARQLNAAGYSAAEVRQLAQSLRGAFTGDQSDLLRQASRQMSTARHKNRSGESDQPADAQPERPRRSTGLPIPPFD